MIAREYRLVEMCVENGIKLGIARAHKHTNCPSEDTVTEHVLQAVMLELSEWFMFEDVDYEAETDW